MVEKQEFEQRLSAVEQRISELKDAELDLQSKLGEAMREGDDQTAKQVQDERAEVKQEQERRQLELQALEDQREEVEKQEAQARLKAIQEEVKDLAKRKGEVVGRLKELLEEAAPLVEESTKLLSRATDIAGEAQYLSVRYGLELPELPELPKAEGSKLCHGLQGKINSEYKGMGGSEWKREARRIQNKRKKVAEAEAEEPYEKINL